jgi:type VI secretion system protein VasG
MDIALKSLLGKLNLCTRSSLEAAIHFCISKKRNVVEPEHWLIKLLEDKKSAINAIFEHLNIDNAEVLRKLYTFQCSLPSNRIGVPSFSRSLVDVMKDSLLLASAEFNASYIHSGHLFLVILTNLPSLALSPELGNILGKIDTKDLKDNLENILKNCDETKNIDEVIASNNSSLGSFTTDLVDAAKKKLLDRAIGRTGELNQIIDILCRRKQNNPILVGEAGVGKTAIVEELAHRIIEGTVPDMLKGISLKVLDLAALQAGANIKGEFEQRLKNIINEIKKSSGRVILFIDEIHNIIGAGSGGSGQNDAANLLKPELARGEIRVIGATTWKEYKKYFEKDAALNRRFQLIKVKEPTEEEAINIVRSVAELLEAHHGVKIRDDAIEATVKLSSRYLTGMQLPDKAISLLDSACTRIKLAQTIAPLELQQDYEKIQLLDQHIKRLQLENFSDNHELQNNLNAQKSKIEEQYHQSYNSWQKKLSLIKELGKSDTTQQRENYLARIAELETLNKDSKPAVYLQVDTNVIAGILSNWTGIPILADNIIKDELESLLNLDKKILSRVIGQDHGIKKIAQNIKIAKANMSDPRKPIGVFLLIGESGVGKTETALSVAEAIYGHECKIITINMSEYKEAHKISTLIGSPPGYVGYGEGGKLTEQVRRSPYSVILLDEMEKAHPDVQELFLQVFDKGTLTDSEGVEINFKNSIIIMTSNAGAKKINEFCHKNKKLNIEELTAHIKESLLGIFKPEFLGRINVIPYLSLDNKMLKEIIRLQFNRIERRLSENYKAAFTYTKEAVDKILAHCKSSKIGARIIEHIISDDILPDLSVQLLEAASSGKLPKLVELKVEEDKFCFRFG